MAKLVWAMESRIKPSPTSTADEADPETNNDASTLLKVPSIVTCISAGNSSNVKLPVASNSPSLL